VCITRNVNVRKVENFGIEIHLSVSTTSDAGRRINFLTLCPKLYRAIRFRKRDYLQILPVISSNPGKVVGPVFLGRSNEKLAAIWIRRNTWFISWFISPLKNVRSLKNRESRNSCSVNVGGVGVSSWSVSSSLSSAKICMAAAMYDAISSHLAAARPAIWNIQKVLLGRRNGPQIQFEYEYRSSYASWIHSTGNLNIGRISVKPISRSRFLIRIARLSLGQSVEKVDPATGVKPGLGVQTRTMVNGTNSNIRLIISS